ncbi:hypothetical protein D3C84_614920 [compost metagenome]
MRALHRDPIGFRPHIRSLEMPAHAFKQCLRRRAIAFPRKHRDHHFAGAGASPIAILDLRGKTVWIKGVSDRHLPRCRRIHLHHRALAQGEDLTAILHARTCGRRVGCQVVAQTSVVVALMDRCNRWERRRITRIEQLTFKAHVRQPGIQIAARRPPRQHLLDASVVFAFMQLQAHTKSFEGQGQQFAFVFQAGLEFDRTLGSAGANVFEDEGLEFSQQIFECCDRDDRRLGQLILTRYQHTHVTTSNV